MKRIVSVVKLLSCVVALWAVTLASVGHATPAAVPEIDPGSFGSALTLVMGSLALLGRRKSA